MGSLAASAGDLGLKMTATGWISDWRLPGGGCISTAKRPIRVVATTRNRRKKQTLPSFQRLPETVQIGWADSIFADYAVRRTTFVDSAPSRHIPKASGPPSNLSAPVLVFAARFRVSDFEYRQNPA